MKGDIYIYMYDCLELETWNCPPSLPHRIFQKANNTQLVHQSPSKPLEQCLKSLKIATWSL
jgi:hypothetical protein